MVDPALRPSLLQALKKIGNVASQVGTQGQIFKIIGPLNPACIKNTIKYTKSLNKDCLSMLF